MSCTIYYSVLLASCNTTACCIAVECTSASMLSPFAQNRSATTLNGGSKALRSISRSSLPSLSRRKKQGGDLDRGWGYPGDSIASYPTTLAHPLLDLTLHPREILHPGEILIWSTKRSNFRRTNSEEIRQKFGDASPDTVRHWLTNRGANNVAIAYHIKFGAKRRLFKDQELIVSQKEDAFVPVML